LDKRRNYFTAGKGFIKLPMAAFGRTAARPVQWKGAQGKVDRVADSRHETRIGTVVKGGSGLALRKRPQSRWLSGKRSLNSACESGTNQ